MITWLLMALVVNIISAVAIYSIAYRRRADCAFWLKAALLWGPFAIPFALFARPKGRITL